MLHLRHRLVGSGLVVGMLASTAIAQCDGWRAGPLLDQPEGVNTTVRAATVWNAPGGPMLLVVGGDFNLAGGVAVNHVAAWDGASWRALGAPGGTPGVDGTVY